MRVHHGVDQSDALGDSHSDQIGERREHAGPEKDRPGGCDRKIEAFEQPQRKHRLHDEAAAKCVDAEQSGECQHPLSRWTQRRIRLAGARRMLARQATIDDRRGKPQDSIENEHRPQCRLEPDINLAHDELRRSGEQRSHRRHERSHETITSKQRSAFAVARDARNQRMLERKEHAHVTARWIERPDEGDDQQRPEAAD